MRGIPCKYDPGFGGGGANRPDPWAPTKLRKKGQAVGRAFTRSESGAYSGPGERMGGGWICESEFLRENLNSPGGRKSQLTPSLDVKENLLFA